MVAVIMGSISDWEQMKFTCEMLDEFDIKYDKKVISAHRMPSEMIEFAKCATKSGYKVIVAGAGGAAHLPGMVAASTTLPVIGVPIKSSTLNGIDSLLSIVQMPAGVPVATMSIGVAGAKNAGIMVAKILSLNDKDLSKKVENFIQKQNQISKESSKKLYE